MAELNIQNAADRSQYSVTVFAETSGRDRLKILSLILLWAALFAPIYPEMVREWAGHSDNSHGFIVPLMTGYFAWQRKEQLQSATVGSSWWGCAVLFLALSLYVLSYAGGLVFPARVALVVSLFGLIWCTLGSDIIRILAFPVLFLLFMIPVPYSLLSLVSAPLQLIATKISATMIGACTIPVYREGNMLYFVNTQLEVAEACSGIRSIMSLSMLAFAFASMLSDGWKNRVILILSAIPIAMVANIIRITGTGVLAHFYGDKVARGFLHEFSGIAIFAFGFMALLGIFTLINRKKKENVQ
jgi:exosortase